MAQVVERYFREVEAASSSLVTPIERYLIITGFGGYQDFLLQENLFNLYEINETGIYLLFLFLGYNKVKNIEFRFRKFCV